MSLKTVFKEQTVSFVIRMTEFLSSGWEQPVLLAHTHCPDPPTVGGARWPTHKHPRVPID